MEAKIVIAIGIRVKSVALTILKLGLVIALIVVGGYAASKGDSKFLVLTFGALLGLFIAFDYALVLIVTVFGGIVISGLMQLYIPKLELVRWAFGCSATLLIAHIFVEATKANSFRMRMDSSIIFWSLVFILSLVCSALLQDVTADTALVSLKGYFQVWGVLFALAFLPWSEEQVKKFPFFLLAVTLIQIPFVLHQYLFLVPMRMGMVNTVEGLVPIDVVSGTFGGKMNHGGANAALTMLCFIAASGVLSLWKNMVITTPYFLILIGLVAFPAFINSTKISALYLLAILFLTYYDEININPLKFIGRLFVGLLLCVVLAFSVISSLPESAQVESLPDLYEQTYNYNVAEDNIRDNRLSRSGTIKAWVDPVVEHRFRDIIVGYGIGSSRIINSIGGERISNTINLDRPTGVTAIAAILWETGVVGLLIIIMLFISAFSVATRLKKVYKHDLFQHSIFTALQSSVAIMFVSLGHKSFFTYHIGFQTLFVIIFGYLAYWERRTAHEAT